MDDSTRLSEGDLPTSTLVGDAPVGAVIAGYRVEEITGAGGMGVVYRAVEPELGRQVALKLISPSYAADARFRRLLQEESRAAAALEHPNVVPIYRTGEEDGQLFIAMRFVDGASLHELVGRLGRLPVGRAVRIVSRVADALDAAHAAGLVHRDVKPANILISDPDGDEQVYLSDFGLSVRTADGAATAGRMAGTLGYCPPEQIRGEPVDARSDVYALGCVLFHALTGREPYPAGEAEAKVAAHLTQPPPRVSDAVPELPRRLDEVIARALAKRPEERFGSAGALAAAARDARSDVLLCRHPDDEGAAATVTDRLRAAGLEARPAGVEVADEMLAAHACYVVVGRAGLGHWSAGALAAAAEVLHADRAFLLACVLLPGAPDPFDPSMAFFADRPLVDLRAGIEETHAGDDLLRPLGAAPRAPSRAADAGRCPYRGLEAFSEHDAEVFFGRDQDVARLLAKLRRTRFLAVLGASGSGKSSLVRAGLMPALREDAPDLRVVALTPGERPLAALAAALGGLGIPAPSEDDLLRDARALQVAVVRAGRLLILVDQLEEAFSLTADPRERRAFLDALVHTATIPGGATTVVLAMRSDFYAQTAGHSALRALIAAEQYLVGPLSREGLCQAVEEPALRAGLELEPGLTRRILADVTERPGALPLLEHLLLELWRRRRGRLLTLEAYAAAGGVEGALAKRANAVYGGFAAGEQAIARRVLLRLTQPGEGTEDTRRRARLEELATDAGERPSVEGVVGALSEARLLTLDTDGPTGASTVEVAHEALIRGWPRLRGWIDEDREALRLQRRLTDAVAEWSAAGRDEALFYRGASLAAWQDRPLGDLNPLEREFLAAGRRLADRERTARRRRVRLAIGGLVAALAAVGVGAGFAVVQRNDAQDQRVIALSRQIAGSSTLTRPRDPELAVLLAERAYSAKPTVEAEEALRQAVHESRVRGGLRLPGELPIATVGADGGAVVVASESGQLRRWDPVADPRGSSPTLIGRWDGGINAVAGVPGGFVTGGADGAVVRWGESSSVAPLVVAKVPGAINDLGSSPDGRRVVVAGDEGLWDIDLTTGRRRLISAGPFYDATFDPLSGGYLSTAPTQTSLQRWRPGVREPETLSISGGAQSLTLSPDGRLLAVAASDGVHVLRMGPRPRAIFVEEMEGGANGVSFAPGGRHLVVAGGDGRVLVLTIGGDVLIHMNGHEGSVGDVVATGASRVVSVANDGTARSWDWATGLDRELRGHAPARGGAVFGPDARVTITEADGSSSIWDPGRDSVRRLLPPVGEAAAATAVADRSAIVAAADGRIVVRAASGAELASWPLDGFPFTLAYDRTGDRVAAALLDGRVVVATIGRAAPPAVVDRHRSAAFAVAFSPADGTLASGGRDGTVKVWRRPGGSRVVGRHGGQAFGVAFSADGRWLASASADRTVRVWDLTGRDQPRVLRDHTAFVLNVAFADDQRLVSRGLDGLRVWDWRRGAVLLTVPEAEGDAPIDVRGSAPAIVHVGSDGVVRVSHCDVCGPIEDVRELARQRSTRDLSETERNDFNIEP